MGGGSGGQCGMPRDFPNTHSLNMEGDICDTEDRDAGT